MKTLPSIKSISLARYILATLGSMSHLKLQKLLYYVEAWHLAVNERSIIEDNFKAWAHGPVCLNVWHHFKNQAILNGDVNVPAAAISKIKSTVELQLAPEQIELITDVLKEYGDKTAYHLECLTHEERPWREARKGVPPGEASANIISKKVMQAFYGSLLANV